MNPLLVEHTSFLVIEEGSNFGKIDDAVTHLWKCPFHLYTL